MIWTAWMLAAAGVCAKTPTAFMDAVRYWTNAPQVEVHLGVDAGSLSYAKSAKGYAAKAAVTLTFFQDGKSVVEDRFVLTTPEVQDTQATTLQFHVVHSERYFPPTGELR
ncbi:MAG: hypothetical protein NZ534_10050, partial [Bacteroidia bacterium]|nr:hypothetical protein [Bacteroidia bacterium]